MSEQIMVITDQPLVTVDDPRVQRLVTASRTGIEPGALAELLVSDTLEWAARTGRDPNEMLDLSVEIVDKLEELSRLVELTITPEYWVTGL